MGPGLRGGPLSGALFGLGVLGTVCFLAAVALPWVPAIGFALAALAAEYVASLYSSGLAGAPGVDHWAALEGVGLLLFAELAYWRTELIGVASYESGVLFQRGRAFVGVSLAALFASAILLVVAEQITLSGGLILTVAGALAGAALLALLALLAR